MTKNIADLHLEMMGDIQKYFLAYLQNLTPPANDNQEPPGWAVSVLLPLHINLRRSPGKKLISSAEKNQPFYLSSQQAQTIKTFATDNHLTQETALIELIRLSLLPHKNLKTISRLLRGKSVKDVQVTLEIKLVGPLKWDEKHTDNPAA
jgi:hypothetical protein